MLVRFWGTRGSLAVAQTAGSIRGKIARALVAAAGRKFATEDEAATFVDGELDFATGGTYGGATTCVEIEAKGDGSFILCDFGTGAREFGINAFGRIWNLDVRKDGYGYYYYYDYDTHYYDEDVKPPPEAKKTG